MKGAAIILVLVALACLAVWIEIKIQRAALQRAAGRPRQVATLAPFTAHWWSAEDIACARSIEPGTFGPNALVKLPSGRLVLSSDLPRIAAIGGRRDG